MQSEVNLKKAIDLHADMVRKICFVHCKCESDVDDIFQEVFIKYYNSSINFNDEQHEKAWIIRVTINACHDLFRGWFKQKAILMDDFSNFSIDTNKDDGRIWEYVRKLKPDFRDVIYLYYYEGYTMIQISKILKVNENTISTRLRRSKQKLKDMIGGDFFE
ncbi:MAG: RNA polymerase sigma factor [Anaerorhabdus sp.]